MVANIKTIILKAKYTYYKKRGARCMQKEVECVDNKRFEEASVWAKRHTQYLKKECEMASELTSIGW